MGLDYARKDYAFVICVCEGRESGFKMLVCHYKTKSSYVSRKLVLEDINDHITVLYLGKREGEFS